MNREQFKRMMKGSVHIGTGLTIKQDKRQASADIEQQTHEFLSSGGEIDRLSSEQVRPVASPAFNRNPNAEFEA